VLAGARLVTRIAGVGVALPPHRYPQPELTAAFAAMCGVPAAQQPILERFHNSAGVATRHLCLPIDDYASLLDFGATNDQFLRSAVDLGAAAVEAALAKAGLTAEEVDVFVSTTVTGLAVPSLEARLAPVLGLRQDVVRVPLFGLGCMAGAAGLARLDDLLAGRPDAVGVLLCVELCSLTLQRADASTANLVASSLFGDGAAAVVLTGAHRSTPGPEVVDSRSHLYPDTGRAMGWDFGSSGLKIVLGAEVPDLVGANLADDVKQFLAAHDLAISDITGWVAHPGGPKVLQAVQRSLGLRDSALDITWQSLQAVGNMSSASVLHVLEQTMLAPPPAGTPGLLLAMGPGFSCELVLLRW
jgi:alkylresorcinol/alkylpyrone synthase